MLIWLIIVLIEDSCKMKRKFSIKKVIRLPLIPSVSHLIGSITVFLSLVFCNKIARFLFTFQNFKYIYLKLNQNCIVIDFVLNIRRLYILIAYL